MRIERPGQNHEGGLDGRSYLRFYRFPAYIPVE